MEIISLNFLPTLMQTRQKKKMGANAATLGLVKLATKEPVDQVWIEDILSCIFYVASQELHALFM